MARVRPPRKRFYESGQDQRIDCCRSTLLSETDARHVAQPRQGTLYLMVGGKQEVFDRAKPLLEKLSDEGKLLRYIGGAGKAAQVKALVNMVMNINTARLGEGPGPAPGGCC